MSNAEFILGKFFFMKKIQLTKEGLKKIKKELDQLKTNKRPLAVERLKKARAMGDLSENSEYTAAKEDLAFVEGRIQELEQIINSAEVVTNHQNTNEVSLGNKVTVELNGNRDEFYIVGEFEADPLNKKLSHTSPIGNSLIGRKIGESVEVNVPAGKMIYKIIDIK